MEAAMNRLIATFLAATISGSVVSLPSAIASPKVLPVPAGGASARQPILDQDARLDRRVTLRLKKSSLSAVVAELGQQAGVALKASPGVADEPAIVYASDQPAGEVMHQLARLFRYRWTRKGTLGRYTYEIYQDLRSQQEEEALRSQRRTLALRGLKSALQTRIVLAGRPPEQLAREAAAHEEAVAAFEGLPRDRRPLAALTPAGRAAQNDAARSYQLREMADPFRRALLRVPAGLTPAQWDALVEGETLRFSTRPEPGTQPLPPAAAAALRRARPSLLPPGVRFGFVSTEAEASFREAERQGAQAWAQADALGVTVQLSLPREAVSSQAVLTVTPEAQLPESHAGVLPSMPVLVVASERLPAPEDADAGAPAVDPAWDTHPVLGRQLPFHVSLSAAEPQADEVGTLNHVLPQIAEAYGINLVADAYRGEPLPLPDLTAGVASPTGAPETERRRLYEVLNLLVAPTARWSEEGSFLQVRRRMWAHDRLAEIPAGVAQAWAAHIRQNGRFSLEDTARLVLTLRDEQLAQFEAVMREQRIGVSLLFETGVDEPARQQAMLRAYGRLHPWQQQTLRAGGAVPVAAMGREARRWLGRALQRGRDGAVAGASGGGIDGVLTLSRAPVVEDEGDPVRQDAEAGVEAPAAVNGPVPRAEEGELHGAVFRFSSPGTPLQAISVALPQVHPVPPAAEGAGAGPVPLPR
jgi:hypothetical protein